MTEVGLKPATARSAVLSILLGVHPPALRARDLVAAVDLVGINAPAARVALTRMVATGDLVRDGNLYVLAPRLLERQRRQDAALAPPLLRWRGDWEQVVVMSTGRTSGERAALRGELAQLRLGELREGVWMRPANLEREEWPEAVASHTRRFTTGPIEDPAGLAAQLFDLEAWASAGRALLDQLSATDDRDAEDRATRFALVAAVVRHLRSDPALPDELRPADWPASALHAAYDDYRAWLISMRPALG